MSYLDNLENNLKAMESREQLDPEQLKRERLAKEAALAEAQKVMPHAEALKSSTFTENLLTAARTIGHSQRTLVRFTWVGQVLRLEAKEKKLELRPHAEGISLVFIENGQEQPPEPVNLTGDAEALVRRWLEA